MYLPLAHTHIVTHCHISTLTLLTAHSEKPQHQTTHTLLHQLHTCPLSVLYQEPWCVYCLLPPPPPILPPVWNTLRRPVACERWLGLGEEKHNYFSPRLFTQRWQKLVWSMKSQKFLPWRGRQIGINLCSCACVCLQSFHLCSFPSS